MKDIAALLTPEVAAVLAAIIGLLAVMIERIRSSNKPSWQATLREEVEILNALPPGSAHDEFGRYVEHQVRERTQASLVRRRDPAGIVLALLFLGFGATLVIYAVRLDGWWYVLLIPASILGLFGAVGLSQDAVKRERDEKGNAMTASDATRRPLPTPEESDGAARSEARTRAGGRAEPGS